MMRCLRQDLIHSGTQRSSTVKRIVVACSINDDDDARLLAQHLHRSFCSTIDLNPRIRGDVLLVIRARPVELSIS